MRFLYVLTLLLSSNLLIAKNGTTTLTAMFHGNAVHTGVYFSELDNLGELAWKFKTNDKIFSSPVLLGDKVFIGSEDKNLYAIDATSGKELWHFTTKGAVSTAAVFKTSVFFNSSDGFLYAVNTRTGKQLWKFKTGVEKRIGAKGLWGMKPANDYMEDQYDFFYSSPAISVEGSNLTVFVGSSEGYLYAIDGKTGALRWKFKTNGAIRSTPAVYKGKVFIGSWDTYVYAIDEKTGRQLWQYKTGSDDKQHVLEGIQASVSIAYNKVYIGGRDGFLHVLDVEKGNLIWNYDAQQSWIVSTAAIKDSTVFISTSDSYLVVALDAITGKEKFKIKTHGYNLGSVALVNNKAFFGDFSGKFYGVNALTGKIEDQFETDERKQYKHNVLDREGNLNFMHTAGDRDAYLYKTNVEVLDEFYKLGAFISSPVIANNILYVGNTNGYLYAMKLK